MKKEITEELERLGCRIREGREGKTFTRDGKIIKIPSEMYSISESIMDAKKLYFDRWNDGYPSMELTPSDPEEIIEYPCLEVAPYFSIFTDSHYSYYLLRADDKNPENPAVYFIDHDGYDEEDAYEVFPDTLSFISSLRTKKEANEIIRGDEDFDVEEIGLLVNISECAKTEVRSLKAPESEIKSLKGLCNYPNIENLQLYKNEISDIRELSIMKNMKELNLHTNRISDVTPLADMQKLMSLNLSKNRIQNISGLKNCTGIRHLDLSGNEISDVSVLQNLTELEFLTLSRNQIYDLNPLKNHPSLISIHLEKNPIEDISALLSISTLEHIYLTDTPVKDLSSLKILPNLKTLK